MDFINSEIDVGNLPLAEQISLQPIQRSYHKILRIEWLITTVILFVIAGVLIFTVSSIKNSYGWIILIASALLISAFHFFMMNKSFPYKAYAVRDRDVLFQKGWLIRTVKICPFNRIQNCSVQSGVLERKYKLASLIIYTAGSGDADMRIPGLLQEEADRLRYFILEKIHKEKDEDI